MNIITDVNTKILRYTSAETPITVPCVIGKYGFSQSETGREGDGKTPLGTYTLRYGLYRKERMGELNSDLPLYPLQKNDGWCDDINDPAYNRPVRLPYPSSAENLWRKDNVYDVIWVLSHNDSPPVAPLGSAIFFHIARKDHRPTLGCVAISKRDMRKLIPALRIGSTFTIQA